MSLRWEISLKEDWRNWIRNGGDTETTIYSAAAVIYVYLF